MSQFLKLIKLFVFSFVILTFLMNLFSSRYYDHYEKSDLAVYNLEVMHGLHEIEGEDLYAGFKEPLWGMSIYYQLFPLSFLMIEISAVLVLIIFVTSIFERGILSEKRDKIIFVCSIIIILWSYFMLFGAWTGVAPAFYNCAKIY